MIKKIVPAFAALLCSLALFAQEPTGGVKGTVITRGTKEPVQNAKLELFSGAELIGTVLSAEDGSFMIPGLADGMYTLVITSSDYMQNTVNVTVNDGYVKNMFNLSLTRTQSETAIEDASLLEFDLDDSGYNDAPTVLFGSNDVFNEIVSYNFSSVRFKNRGFASEAQDVYLSGVKMNDAMTGYGPFSLWSGLNEATRAKDATTGNEMADVAFSGYNGSTNIFGDATSMRTGRRFSVLTNTAFYRLRLMGSYATGVMDNGWAFAVNASARLGGNDWIKGVYYRSFAYSLAASKVFDHSKLHFIFLGTPGRRGAQNGSTQEVYDLVGDNMYNSNWGYQNGVIRNARERRTHEPIAVVRYDFKPTDRFEGSATVLYRFGKNGYTALDWYNAQDPRPDYYRNLPSYFYNADPDWNRNSESKAAWANEVWTNSGAYPQYTHINWDKLYQVNRNDVDANGQKRAHYVQQERRTDQKDLNFATHVKFKAADFLTMRAGASAKINKTEYYNIVADLLGGDYFVNIDNFADRDYASNPAMVQNDLDYYNAHGEAQKVKVGDKYSHDYFAHVQNYEGWVGADFASGNFSAKLAGRLGYSLFWREGVWKKGLFPDNSQGDSEHLGFLTYAGKAALNYVIGGNMRVYANVGYYEDAPRFNQAFLSPRTRNSVASNLTTSKTFASDLNWQYSGNGYNVRLTGFYATIKDQTDLMSFYDDLQNAFTNFSMTGIDERHMGVELGFKVPLPVDGFSLKGAASVGEYIYTSTPHMTQTVDNSARIIVDNAPVTYWKSSPLLSYDSNGNIDDHGGAQQKHYVPSTPQTAASLGLSWNKNYWFIDADVEYFDRNYLDMNPFYRTDQAVKGPDGIATAEEILYMTAQEKFDPAWLVNFSVGKSWYIKYKYQLGVNLNAKNVLNNTNVKTGGYEQTRLVDNTTSKTRYYRFDPRYFYYAGFNYMINVYFRF